jgi:hypothetical protein
VFFKTMCMGVGLTLLTSQAFGFSTGSSSLVRSVPQKSAVVGSTITMTATFTNREAAILRGFYYVDQLPSALLVGTAKVTLNGRTLTNSTFESGQDGNVYAGLTPRRWRLETPTNFSEANPISSGGVVQIIYTITASSAGTYSLDEFAWAACYAEGITVAFGNSEAADLQTVTFTNPAAASTWSLYWQSTAGDLAEWSMSGANLTSGALLQPSSAEAGWKVVGIGGFGGNTGRDLLMQNNDGRLAASFMNGFQRTGGGYLNPSSADPHWKIVATGDFTQDGKTTILWEHTSGTLAYWFMSGTNRVGGGYLSPSVDPNWQIVGTGDFNRDGKTDILWQHTTGTLACWFMDGTNRIGGGYLSPSVNSNWRIVGTQDVDIDGQTDILWEHSSGSLAIWYMSGTNLVSGTMMNPSEVDPSWRVVGPK